MKLEIAPRLMTGDHITLEPFRQALRSEMRPVLDCDPAGWSQMISPGFGDHFDAWWATCFTQIADAGRIAYAIRSKSTAKVVGTTSFMSLRPQYGGALIGGTFIAPSGRGGMMNAEAKRLMLGQAFDAGALRVEFWVAGTNVRGQAALDRFGIVREGVMRRHWIGWSGEIHDTVIYAVTDQDWPSVRTLLLRGAPST